MKRRYFLKGSASILVNVGLSDIVKANECGDVYSPPRFSDIDGISNRCARYALLASKYAFGNCFQWKDAWQFAEFNYSVEKVVNMRKDNFNEDIYFFIKEDILKPGMIAGTFYTNSSWNGKFYNERGKVSRIGGENKKPILYTHLMCYAGRDEFGVPVFWHQFPYLIKSKRTGKVKKIALQKSIRLDELEGYGLFIKELIDVPRENSKWLRQCKREVEILGYGNKKG